MYLIVYMKIILTYHLNNLKSYTLLNTQNLNNEN